MRRYLSNHLVHTTEERGWSQLENGDLLKAAETSGFQVLVTADQNLTYQQNMTGRNIALIVLSTNRLPILDANPERLVWAVEAAKPGSYEFVRYELPPKPKWSPKEPGF